MLSSTLDDASVMPEDVKYVLMCRHYYHTYKIIIVALIETNNTIKLQYYSVITYCIVVL